MAPVAQLVSVMRLTAARILLLLSVFGLPASTLTAQRALFFRHQNLVPSTTLARSLDACVQQLCRGPNPNERALGFISYLPSTTRLIRTSIEQDTATIVLSEEMLAGQAGGHLEDAIEQIDKTVLSFPGLRGCEIRIRRSNGCELTLNDALLHPQALATTSGPGTATSGTAQPAASLVQPFGALSGRRIAVSPGHGYYWHTSLGWTTQRGLIDGLIEDIHVAEICNRFLIPFLQNMGADIVHCREPGEVPSDSLVDNDAGAPSYTETGGWSTSASSGYQNSTYRFAGSNPNVETATATWQVPIAQDGLYPVFAWFRASGNRTPEANYRIHHAGGVTTAIVDQTVDNLTWAHLGDYWFTAQQGARIELSNLSPSPGVVIADAVRVGGGMGSIQRGGSTSGQARWRECSRYWSQFSGAPSSVYNTASQDNADDVTARPRFAEWRGADAFLSVHTNAGGGSGTSTFIYSGGATAGSSALSQAVHTQIIQDMQSEWSATWTDRGQMQANFGELRLLSSMPGILVELAFHDTPGSFDIASIHDPEWRYLVSRAYARGVLRYFSPGAPFPPEPPTAMFVRQGQNRDLEVHWDPTSGATYYTVEQSLDGKGFVEVAGNVTGTSWSTGPLPHHSWRSFRVRAWNASGRSFPTEVLTAGTDHLGESQLLLVQGFDRLGRTVKSPENTRDYLHTIGDACRTGANFSLGFDAASNEAVQLGRVLLPDYDAVFWSLGEESTADDTFDSTEQSLVSSYLAGGGNVIVSGAEVGWDLDAQGSSFDRAFFRNSLGATYVADDANSYSLQAGIPNTISAGVAAAAFDDGSGSTYNVDFADVLQPSSNNGQICLRYSNGLGAAIQTDNPAQGSRTIVFGLPIETILQDEQRRQLVQQALRFVLDDMPLRGPGTATMGQATPFELSMPSEAGLDYVVAISEGFTPGTPLPLGNLLPLNNGPILQASITPASPFFPGFLGTLDSGGNATPTLLAPVLPILDGLPLYVAGFTLVPGAGLERKLSNWIRVTLSL